jgi:hypothetical protein
MLPAVAEPSTPATGVLPLVAEEDLQAPAALELLGERARGYVRARKSPNTLRGRRIVLDWRRFG